MNCPYCKEYISEWAVKCKHCGEFLDKKYKKPSKLLYRKMFHGRPKIYCPECWYEGQTSKTEQKGSLAVTLVLLIFMIIPWIIYEVWRGKPYCICPECKNKYINKIS